MKFQSTQKDLLAPTVSKKATQKNFFARIDAPSMVSPYQHILDQIVGSIIDSHTLIWGDNFGIPLER